MINILMMINLSFADNTQLIYSNINKGEIAPYNGILLTKESMAEIISNHESELKICSENLNYELEKQKNDFNLKYDLYSARCENEKLMYQEMVSIRDNELKKDRIKDVIQRTAFFGGFILGATSCIIIVNSLN